MLVCRLPLRDCVRKGLLHFLHRHDIKIRNKRLDFHQREASRGFRGLGIMNMQQAETSVIKHKTKQSRGI